MLDSVSSAIPDDNAITACVRYLVDFSLTFMPTPCPPPKPSRVRSSSNPPTVVGTEFHAAGCGNIFVRCMC